jgi:purine-binding chemotaxis protein CheW
MNQENSGAARNPAWGELDEIVARIDDAISAGQEMILPAASEWGAGTAPAATPTYIPAGTDNQEKYVIVALDQTRYAIPINNMLEVSRLRGLTALPSGPDWLLGLTSLRGDIISVIDCRALFQMPPVRQPEQHRLCVVRTQNHDLTTGLIVDRVEGLVYLSTEQISETAVAAGEVVAPWLQGVCQHDLRLLNVLRMETLLRSLETVW